LATIGYLQHEQEITAKTQGHQKIGRLSLSQTRFRSKCCAYVGKSCQMINTVSQGVSGATGLTRWNLCSDPQRSGGGRERFNPAKTKLSQRKSSVLVRKYY